MLKTAYNSAIVLTLQRYKIAGPMGADVGVMPKGDEWSHGTNLNQYPQRTSADPGDPANQAIAEGNVDKLWNISNIDKMAPGMTGFYGTENIG